MATAKFTVTCGRCLGTGRYDRGTCFGCNGACKVSTSRKPSRYMVTGIAADGVRRIMGYKAAKSPEVAIAEMIKKFVSPAWIDWKDMDTSTVAAKLVS